MSSAGVQTTPAGTGGAQTSASNAPITQTQPGDTTTTPTPPGNTTTDDFARPDSADLGAGWTAMNDGGLAISSHTAVGTSDGYSGDIRTGESYSSDQYSQIVLTSTQLTDGQWVGPTVRSQNGGQDTYLGMYFWPQSGAPNLRLYKRSGGQWTQLGDSYPVAPLPAGTVLTLVTVGSQVSLLENGVERIAATDNTLTGGSPGLMTYETASAASWTGDDATATNPAVKYSVGGTVSGLAGTVELQNNAGDDLTIDSDGSFEFPTPLADGANYQATITGSPAGQTCTTLNANGTITAASVTNITVTCNPTAENGVVSYTLTSPHDGGGSQIVRVLTPTNPAPGVPHNFLYVLPVEPNEGTEFGDAIGTLASLDAQNQYNLTIIEPSFPIDPWYANNPNNPSVQYETFMTQDLVPWVQQNFGGTGGGAGTTTGGGQNWLIGFSKSGLGAQDLIFKYPQLFALAASWDFPADMDSYSGDTADGLVFGSSSENAYGTDANFQANYRLTPSFLDAHKTPFLSSNRIWIGSYDIFERDISDYDALLTSEGIQHTTEAPLQMAHGWDAGWMKIALSALSQDGAALAAAS